MTTGATLLQDLTARGVVLTAEAGRLRYRAPAGAVTPDLRRQLERHKAALVALLSAQQTSLFDGAAPSPDAGPLVPHTASQAPQDGASAPDLTTAVIQRETVGQGPVIQAETGNGASLAEPDSRLVTGSALRPLVAGRGQDLAQDPHAARLVHGDFERARARLAALEAEIDAGLAPLAHRPLDQWPADLVERLNALAREALTLAPVAEYGNLEELETATGAAYQAVVKCPSDQSLVRAYARLDDAWAAVLGLPDLPHEVKNGL